MLDTREDKVQFDLLEATIDQNDFDNGGIQIWGNFFRLNKEKANVGHVISVPIPADKYRIREAADVKSINRGKG